MLIRKLEFVLENCEVITIDGKYIGDFHAGDIRKEVSRMACNHIGIMEICHNFCVEIHKDANIEYSPFGCGDWKTTIFERLTKHNDITAIDISLYDQYEDDGNDIVEHYYIHWGDDDEYNNSYQSSKVSKNGWLYIVASKDTAINEVYPDENIDDKDFIEFHEEMFDIGDRCWKNQKLTHSDESDH